MSTKDLALRIVKDQFGVLAEEICRFVSNRGHPSYPEIIRNAKTVFAGKVNDTKISTCVLSLCLHSILVPVIPSAECTKIIATFYTFDTKAALYRLRLGSCIQYIREEFGEECASIASEFGIRGSATIEEVLNSILDAYPALYTKSSLSHAADILISRNFVCQKPDIATYARRQNSPSNPDGITRQPAASARSRGRGRGRGGRGGRGGSSSSSSRLTSAGMKLDSEMELAAGRRRARALGDQILEMQAKKVMLENGEHNNNNNNNEYDEDDNGISEAVRKAREEAESSSSVVENERATMLFMLNIEQYTCVLRDEIILRFVNERVKASTGKILKCILSMTGLTRSTQEKQSAVFNGQQVYSHLEDKSALTWSIFLRHMKVLTSEKLSCLTVITPCESSIDATGGEYKVNYEGVIQRIVEDTVAKYIETRYTYLCSSIFRALLKHKKLDEQQVAMLCLLPEKECRTSLYSLLNERLVRSQEVPRMPDRNPKTTIYLFTADLKYAVQALIDFIYVIILNLRSRQKDVVMKKATLYEVQRRGNLSEHQQIQLKRMEEGLRSMDMSILKLDQTLAIIRDMY